VAEALDRLQSIFSIVDSAQSRGWRRCLPYALLVSVTLAIYLRTLAYGFVWDDAQYIVDNFTIQSLRWENLRTIWTTTHLYNYAPLHLLMLSLIHAVSGLDPFGYHLVQFLLHGICVCLVYQLIERIESSRVALVSALWFAVYAPNVETVAWVSETKSTLAFIFFLISFLFFIRHRKQARTADAVWCGIFLILSLLTKVSTIVAPAVFLAYDLRDVRRPLQLKWRSLLCYTAISATFAAIHIVSSRVMRQGALERLRDAAITSPAELLTGSSATYFGGFWTHVLNVSGLLLHYLRMSIVPRDLSPWQMVNIDTTFNLHAALMWGIALALLLGLNWMRPAQRFWAFWFLLFLAPVLQMVPNATWVADRYLYIPAIGIFVLLSKSFFHAVDMTSSILLRAATEAAAVAALFLLGWQAHGYVSAWSDDVALWSRALPRCEQSAFCHYKLGDALLDAGRGEPIAHFQHAVAIRPEVNYQIALARAYTDEAGDYLRANQLYQEMQQDAKPLPLRVITSIARNYYLAGDLEKAERAIGAGLGLNPDFSSLLVVKSFVLWRRQEFTNARSTLRQALEINRANPQAQHPPKFLNDFWQRPAEVGALLRDVGPL